MTVKQLITQLKKMPKDLEVYWADHDHGTYEMNNIVNSVYHIEKPDEEYELDELKQYEYERKDYGNLPEEYVCIRP